jgi:hypothetical protein
MTAFDVRQTGEKTNRSEIVPRHCKANFARVSSLVSQQAAQGPVIVVNNNKLIHVNEHGVRNFSAAVPRSHCFRGKVVLFRQVSSVANSVGWSGRQLHVHAWRPLVRAQALNGSVKAAVVCEKD